MGSKDNVAGWESYLSQKHEDRFPVEFLWIYYSYVSKTKKVKLRKEALLTGGHIEKTEHQLCWCQQPQKPQEPGPSLLASVFRHRLVALLAESLTALGALAVPSDPISKNSPFNRQWQEFQWFISEGLVVF